MPRIYDFTSQQQTMPERLGLVVYGESFEYENHSRYVTGLIVYWLCGALLEAMSAAKKACV
jgi:hypothetical protein